MTSDRPASRARHSCRAALGPLSALGLLLAFAPPAAAQETRDPPQIQPQDRPQDRPLVLRIRPQPDPADAARAAREAVWARSQARARAVIASVCTGCLAPWRPPEAARPPEATARPPEAAVRTPEPAPESRVAALADPEPPPTPAPSGLESDPALGASEPTSEPPSRERHP